MRLHCVRIPWHSNSSVQPFKLDFSLLTSALQIIDSRHTKISLIMKMSERCIFQSFVPTCYKSVLLISLTPVLKMWKTVQTWCRNFMTYKNNFLEWLHFLFVFGSPDHWERDNPFRKMIYHLLNLTYLICPQRMHVQYYHVRSSLYWNVFLIFRFA